MALSMHLPAGFRFRPDDEELIAYSLYPKITNPLFKDYDPVKDSDEIFGAHGKDPWLIWELQSIEVACISNPADLAAGTVDGTIDYDDLFVGLEDFMADLSDDISNKVGAESASVAVNQEQHMQLNAIFDDWNELQTMGCHFDELAQDVVTDGNFVALSEGSQPIEVTFIGNYADQAAGTGHGTTDYDDFFVGVEDFITDLCGL